MFGNIYFENEKILFKKALLYLLDYGKAAKKHKFKPEK